MVQKSEVKENHMNMLGNQIQDARKKANMTQAQLAGFVGVSPEEIASWEKNETKPDKEQLQAMSDKLGVVLFNPQSVEAQRKSDEKLEQLKAAEFQGKKSVGTGKKGSGEEISSKLTWLIPLALMLFLMMIVFVLVQPSINQLNKQMYELQQSVYATSSMEKLAEKKVEDIENSLIGVRSTMKDMGDQIDTLNTQVTDIRSTDEILSQYIKTARGEECSNGAQKNYYNGYNFKSSDEENKFATVCFKLYNAEGFLKDFGYSNTPGLIEGRYLHLYPTGEYQLQFKANANISDEFVSKTVYLVQNKSYHYSYDLKKMSDDLVIIYNISFTQLDGN